MSIQAYGTNRCLDRPGSFFLDRVHANPCNANATSQNFSYNPVTGQFLSAGFPGLVLDGTSNSPDTNGLTLEDMLILNPNGHGSQSFTHNPDTLTITIRSNPTRCMEYSPDTHGIRVRNCVAGLPTQKWIVNMPGMRTIDMLLQSQAQKIADAAATLAAQQSAAAIAAQKALFDTQLAQQQQTAAAQLTQQQQAAAALLTQRLAEQKTALDASCTASLTAARQAQETALVAAKATYDSQLQAANAAALQQRQTAIAAEQAACTTRLSAAATAAAADRTAALVAAATAAAADRTAALATASTAATADRNAALSAAASERTAALAAAKSACDAEVARVTGSTSGDLKAFYEQKMTQAQQECKDSVAAMRLANENTLTALRATHDSDIKTADLRHQADLNAKTAAAVAKSAAACDEKIKTVETASTYKEAQIVKEQADAINRYVNDLDSANTKIYILIAVLIIAILAGAVSFYKYKKAKDMQTVGTSPNKV